MKLLQIYNQYRSLFNGEETVVFRTAELVEQHGHTARLLMRSSRTIGNGWGGRFHAFFSGIYNMRAAAEVTRVLREYQPDIVHAHNLYPLFSPSVLAACRRVGTPVVLSLHNQNLTCPRSDHLYRGKICEKCFGGREYHCVLQNCRENIFESIGYATRAAVARKLRLFERNVTVFIALTQFARRRLIQVGLPADRICVLPNMAPDSGPPVVPADGKYVAFAGRLSQEKGLDVLLDAAARIPDVPIRIAGSGPLMDEVRRRQPPNIELLGQLNREEMAAFYRQARLLVLPSTTYEMSPLVIAEAMSHGLPVVASRLGGIPELVDHERTGLLFAPGNSEELAARLAELWRAPLRCELYGANGYAKAREQYGEQAYYANLVGIYRQAMTLAGRPAHTLPVTEPLLESVAR